MERRKRIAAVVALLLAVVMAVGAWAVLDGGVNFRDLPFGPSQPVRFLVTGDTGTGDELQFQVGAAMASVCNRRGCDFVLLTGDVFYPSGVESVQDPKWWELFEQPYANLNVPFYAVAGNHDYENPDDGEDLAWDRVNALVDYSYHENGTGPIWRMPGRYYTFERENVEFIGLDTTPVVVAENQTLAGQVREAQGRWLQQVVDGERDKWRFAFGHHPYISNGEHGGDPYFRSWYAEHLCGQLDVYFGSHDHDLQWLRPDPACGNTHFLISGAGGDPRSIEAPERHPAWFQMGDTGGFLWVEVDGSVLTATFYDANGRELYERSVSRDY